MHFTPSQLLHGSVDPLPERMSLRAGPVTLVLEAGDLRSIQIDGVDVINRIYGAVRDGEWATIPGRLSDLRVERDDETFHVSYTSEHAGGDVDFVWQAAILFDPPRADATCWGMHPQAHATDATSIAETPVAAGHQLRAVRLRRPGPIAISVVRLHKVLADPRQMSLLGAAWTLAVLAELVAEGAGSITIYDTIGPRGVMADDVVFPLFHVIADVGELADGPGISIMRPADGVTGLLTRRALLLANLSREPRTVTLPDGCRPKSLRLLDATSARSAMTAPDAFRARTSNASAAGVVTLPPFATARLDLCHGE